MLFLKLNKSNPAKSHLIQTSNLLQSNPKHFCETKQILTTKQKFTKQLYLPVA